MKKFLLESFLFSIIALSGFTLYENYYFNSSKFIDRINGSEIYAAIKQSKTKHYRKKLIIGDSVGCQLFPSSKDNDSIAFMACNQAITLAGMYFLVSNYIDTNKDSLPEEVILLCTPGALHNYLDQYSYHYFLKPFKLSEYGKYVSPLLENRIHEVKLWWTAELPFFRTSNYSTKYSLSDKDYVYVSPLSKEYILKIDSVLTANNISFRMQSVPVKEVDKDSLDTLLRKSIIEQELPERLLIPFYESVFYMPSSAYVDHCHFNQEALDTIDRKQFVGETNMKHQSY